MTVYITQETHLNLNKARPYGSMVPLTSYHDSKLRDPNVLRNTIAEKLVDYTDDDYILCVGNPTIIGLVCAMASEMNNGQFNLLQWDRVLQDYFVMRVEL